MGMELEFKLSAPGPEVLERLLADAEITAMAEGPFRQTPMETVYFDTEAQAFSRKHWTLRLRQEGDKHVACLKTPCAEPYARNEWQVEARAIDDAVIERLLDAGAPQELLACYGSGPLYPLCSASFRRLHGMLRFPDGSRAELACDQGVLRGAAETLPFAEVELELCEGTPERTRALAEALCRRYGLREERRSKFARAKELS